ncbi:hypothetical protein [Aquimarina sp. AU474]|uniref:hypothetical protein n=1 Tax=Aquimarina sp. AU474 TaxID=2108529 RepID=UPI00135B2DB6|nr:hypothetical protein [Aquimarina sp. AU474]
MKIFELKGVKIIEKIVQKTINAGRRPQGDDQCVERCLRSGSPLATCYQQCDLGPAPGR